MRTGLGLCAVVAAITCAPRASHAGDDAAAAITAAAPACPAERAHCFAIELHVAADDSGLVVTPAWVAAQLAEANRHFAAIDVGFELESVDALPASAAHIVTRRDRDRLGDGHLDRHRIEVFLIAKLEDVDNPGDPVFGVTWRQPRDDRKYVFVAANAFGRTLAHELGHVFGLPHSEYAISIMNKTPRDEPPMEQRTFADEEVALLRKGLTRIVREHSFRSRDPRGSRGPAATP